MVHKTLVRVPRNFLFQNSQTVHKIQNHFIQNLRTKFEIAHKIFFNLPHVIHIHVCKLYFTVQMIKYCRFHIIIFITQSKKELQKLCKDSPKSGNYWHFILTEVIIHKLSKTLIQLFIYTDLQGFENGIPFSPNFQRL